MATADVIWRVQLFTTLRLSSGNSTIERFQTEKTAMMLALLAINPGKRHYREQLTDQLWPDAPIESGRNRLNQALSWLRKQLEFHPSMRGKVLEANRNTIALNRLLVESDVGEFERLLERATLSDSDPSRLEDLSSAVTLYTGELLPGVCLDKIAEERGRLFQYYVKALLQLSTVHRRRGEPQHAAEYAQQAVTSDPLLEEAHEQLIACLIDAGQRVEAQRKYRELEALLLKELSVSPSPSITRLAMGSHRTSAAPGGDLFAPTPLPRPITRFFGRTPEIDQVSAVLKGGARLLTVLGIGGSGKTRLAIETAGQLSGVLAGKALFVQLADLTVVSAVPSAIADSLRLQRSPEEPVLDQVIDFLSGSEYLMILDNAEHLLPALSQTVQALLTGLPQLSLLITSRQRLGLAGEHELHLSSLGIPTKDETLESIIESESGQLFLDRLQIVQPDFLIDPESSQIIAELCRRLDGIPLAIELCAAWGNTLSLQQMLDRLKRPFELLISDRSDIARRHRSLRATFQYSLDQLAPDLQRFFARLSVFRGGWSLEAIEAIHQSLEPGSPMFTLESLAELRGRSMIESDEFDNTMRYRMLESLMEFAREQLTQQSRMDVHRAHTEYYANLAAHANDNFQGPAQHEWATRLDNETQNIDVALRWCAENNRIEQGLVIASRLTAYWKMRGRLEEAGEWLETFLTAAREQETSADRLVSSANYADGLTACGMIEWSKGNFTSSGALHRSALEIREHLYDAKGIAESLYYIGITAYRQDLFDQAEADLQKSLEISRKGNNPKGVSRALLNLGNIALTNSRPLEARGFYEQALEIERELGDIRRIADTLSNVGLTYGSEDKLDDAKRYFEQSVAIRRRLNDHFGLASDLFCVGKVSYHLRDNLGFRDAVEEGLQVAFRTQNKYILAQFFLTVAIKFVDDEQFEQALYFLCAYTKIRVDMGVLVESPTAAEYHDVNTRIITALGEEKYSSFHRHVLPLSLRQLSEESHMALEFGTSFLFPRRSLDVNDGVEPIRLCPYCRADQMVKFGRNRRNVQRYRCNSCTRVIDDDHFARQTANNRRAEILDVYHRGLLSMREISRTYRVSRNTLTRWIKAERTEMLATNTDISTQENQTKG